MSHDAVNWVLGTVYPHFSQEGAGKPKMKAGPRMVLLMLAHHHNGKTGQLNPSQDTLARECGISRASLNTHLSELEDHGLIERIQKRNPKTKRADLTEYRLACFSSNPASRIWTQPQNVGGPSPETGHGNDPEPCPESGQTRVQILDSKEGSRKMDMCEAHTHGHDDLINMVWSTHPKPRDRKATAAAIIAAVEDGESPSHIIAGVKAYALEQRGNNLQYVAGSNYWTKDRRWRDFPESNVKTITQADREAMARKMLTSRVPSVQERGREMLQAMGLS